jgi:ADP-dependent NAD(P)H-hydrate dehydratase
MTTPADLPLLPARDTRGHKGTFGTVSIVGGCATADHIMAGAPALAALGALRSGCGLAKLLIPAAVAPAALSVCPSATCVPLPVDGRGALIPSNCCPVLDAAAAQSGCVVVGPGMGPDAAVANLTLRLLQQDRTTVVIDADAINALAAVPDLHLDLRAAAVLTPHPGEFRRLASVLRITQDPTNDASRPDAAAAMARKLGAIVVLKGAGTIVSDGLETWRCPTGHSCLATAGSGDVLAGVIAGMIAQHGSHHGRAGGERASRLSILDATRLAVFAHGMAG